MTDNIPHIHMTAARLASYNDPLFNQSDKVAVFIDGTNLYASIRALGIDLDYRKLLEWLHGTGRLVRVNYYTAMAEDEEYSPIRPMVDWLAYNGYSVVTKAAKTFTNNGVTKTKGNMDIEIAVDALELADSVDHIFLFSGDGDFRRMIESIQRKGVRVTVISTLDITADELRRQADWFIDMKMLQAFISREETPGTLTIKRKEASGNK